MEERIPNFEVSRKVWQPLWCYIMAFISEDMASGYKKFENKTFSTEPYDWGWEGEGSQVNFHHKPSGYKISWYKYPMRGTTANMDITPEQFTDILWDCVNSTSKNVTHEINAWWKEGKNGGNR